MRSLLSRRDLLVPRVAGQSELTHIASLLLQIVPSRLAAVREVVTTLPGAEIHPTAHHAKFAVLLEANDERELANATEALSQVPGVLTVSIVAHLTEQTAVLEEAIDHESPAVPQA